MLRLAFATGTEPEKWFRRYRENTAHGGLEAAASDDPLAELLAGEADAAIVRVPDPRVDEQLHRVLLYEEAKGVAVPKESVFAEAGEELRPADLTGEHINYRIGEDALVDVAAVRTALSVVAANVGVAIAPRPLLKVLSKKRVVALGYCDDAVPSTEVALVWRKEDDCEAIQDFVGITKGRTQNSSRQARPKKRRR